MNLEIEISSEEGIPVIQIVGELTYATKNRHLPLQTIILRKAKEKSYKLILDLSRTKLLDSQGFSNLVEVAEIIKLHGEKTAVVTQNIIFKKIFKFRKLANLFTVFDSLFEAGYSLTDLPDFANS